MTIRWPSLFSPVRPGSSRHIAVRSLVRWLLPAFAALLLAGCATGYGGGYGNGYGTPGGGYGDYGSERILGTVQDVDPRSGRILLDTDDGYRGSRLELRVDRNTTLFYQGRQHAVAGLERGDRISVEAVRSGSALLARRIEVVHNVREGYRDDRYGDDYYGDDRYGDNYGNDGYGDGLRGAVAFVDPRAQVIGIDRGGYGGRPEEVRYDSRTQVEYRGQYLRPEQLERGDVIRIEARRWGNGWLAERILVERNVRDY